MKANRFYLALLLLGLSGAGCWPLPAGPSESLSGRWAARGIGHGLAFEMSLQQSGDTIIGVACGISDGIVIFRNAPVEGDYPHVRFAVTPGTAGACCSHLVGSKFSGKIDDTHDIVGSSDFGSDLRFKRATDPSSCSE
jgi:hypothetical protein